MWLLKVVRVWSTKLLDLEKMISVYVWVMVYSIKGILSCVLLIHLDNLQLMLLTLVDNMLKYELSSIIIIVYIQMATH